MAWGVLRKRDCGALPPQRCGSIAPQLGGARDKAFFLPFVLVATTLLAEFFCLVSLAFAQDNNCVPIEFQSGCNVAALGGSAAAGLR